VCEELEGSPNHHVIRFHIIAAVTAAAIRFRLTIFGSITPLPIVFATFSSKTRNAIKLKEAARPTAAIGDKTLVDTMVAMEFAES